MAGQIIHMSKMGRTRAKRPHLMPGGGLWSRSHRLGRDAVAHWNADNKAILNRFGLRISQVIDLPIMEPLRNRGEFEVRESERVSLAAALPALATAFEARGSILRLSKEVTGNEDKLKKATKQLKSVADMWATGAMTAGFRHIVNSNPRFAISIVVGEGDRPKPGEGRNPTLFGGQLLAGQEHLGIPLSELPGRGVSVVNGAVDPIDGTGKTVNGFPSAITSLVLVNGPIAMVPDGRFEKLILPPQAADRGLDLSSSFAEIAEGISDGCRINLNRVNTFMLDRECHPSKMFAKEIGITPVLDKDGDLMPGITAMLQEGLIVNGEPLRAMFGNSGGAAEFLLAAIPAMWLGGEAFGQLVSDTMKKNGWDRRFEYTPEEIEAIKAAGLETQRIYPVSELVPGVKESDGVAAFGAIWDNWHLPYHDGVRLGNGFAEVEVLKIGASGAVLLRRFVFTFEQANAETAELFRPILIRLAGVDPRDLRGEIRNILKNDTLSRALRDEFGTAYHDVFTLTPEGRMVINQDAVDRNLAEQDKVLVKELQDLAPDWFST